MLCSVRGSPVLSSPYPHRHLVGTSLPLSTVSQLAPASHLRTLAHSLPLRTSAHSLPLPRTPGRFPGSPAGCSAGVRLLSPSPARHIRPLTAWARTPLPGAGTWKPTFAHAHNLGSRAALPMCTVGLLTAPGAGPAGCGHIEDGTCPLRVLPEMHKPNNNRPNKNRRDKVWTMKGLARAKAG